MVGLILVTHGQLAKEFLHAVEHVVGKQENFTAICIGAEDDMDQRRQDIIHAIEQVKDAQGVIILTDMFGGTPSNLAISVMKANEVEVIAGLNLPMLIKLTSLRRSEDLSMLQILQAAQDAGRKYINIPSMILAGK